MSRALKQFPFHGAEGNLIREHLQSVLDGEYGSSALLLPEKARILDLGANIGAFAYWALRGLPKAHVYSYEPISENITNYKRNMNAVGIPKRSYTLTHGAVYPGETELIRIYKSPVNSGMHSAIAPLAGGTEDTYEDVPRIDPADLPNCDMIKLDIEGCELNVLREYLKTHPLPTAVSLEFHTRYDRFEIENLLEDDYLLHTCHMDFPDLGVMNFLRLDIA